MTNELRTIDKALMPGRSQGTSRLSIVAGQIDEALLLLVEARENNFG